MPEGKLSDVVFGMPPPPPAGTAVVARPIPLEEIWADVRQPRRAIPASIRLVWNGNPADVPALLATWGSVAANTAGRVIDIQKIITGDGEGVDTDGTPPIYESFISLLRLAASIRSEGLINPISIIDQRDRHLIESGERRWLAYWLLRLHTQDGEKFSRIPSVTASGADFVWRQAAENTARRSLNAVGMSRQLALLIMAARGDDQYHDFDQIVPPGASDRRFYAQVADGNVHRIPKGSGERIQAAMGLSESQLAQYRRLLHITDDDEVNDQLWMRGDIEDWPERAFRDVYTFTLVKVRDILSRDGWSLDDFRAAAASPSPSQWGGARGGDNSSHLPPSPSIPGVPPRTTPPSQQPPRTEPSEEARQVLSDIRQAFARVYALEGSPNTREQVAANNATRMLNHAQTYYDNNHLDAARKWLGDAFRILDHAANAGDNSPHASGDGIGDRSPSSIKEFYPGDIVKTPAGHEGTVIRVNGQIVIVQTANGQGNYSNSFLSLVRRAGQTATEDEPASDNTPSDGSQSPPIMDRAAPIYTLLFGIQRLAQATDHQDTADTVTALMNMTWDDVRQLAENDRLNDAMQLHFNNINNALSAWSGSFNDFLNDLYEQLDNE